MTKNEFLTTIICKGAALFRGSAQTLKTIYNRLFLPVEVGDNYSVNNLANLIQAQGIQIKHLRELIAELRECGYSDTEIHELFNRQVNLMITMSDAIEVIARHIAKGTVLRAELVRGVIQVPSTPAEDSVIARGEETESEK